MKFTSLSPILLLLSSASAFAPASHINKAFLPQASSVTRRFMAEDPAPLFEPSEATASKSLDMDDMSLEEEIEKLVQEELAKSTKASKMRTATGQEYAPWMRVTEKEEGEIRQAMKSKAEARRRREEQERSVSGNLYLDSQAQELSGTGLNAKVLDENSVELEWATRTEADTKGFIIKRRPAKTEDFQVIASYEDWGPLQSKGPDGGIYRYLDTEVSAGGWVYRVSECDNGGGENDICQCLVEIQTQEEQRAAVIAAVGIGALAVVALGAGLLLDPMQ